MSGEFPHIVIDELTVGYHPGKDQKILISGFSGQLIPGETIALMGSNGSGKSTLLRTITGSQRQLSGKVLLNGKSISGLSMREKARYISYVSTEPVRVGNMSVFDLVGLGRYLYSGAWGSLSANDIAVVNQCIELTGMKGFEYRQMNGLSDGERQRCMIARALAQDTPVIILDEPTAFLDVRNKYEIIHLLRKLAAEQGKSIIFSSHDFSISLGMADKIWLIKNEKLVEGAPEDLALQNHFQSLFEGSPIAFHPESGEVIMAEPLMRGIQIDAPANLRGWIVKAMQRKGVFEDTASVVKLVAKEAGGETLFFLEKDGKTSKYTSVYSLLKDDFFSSFV